MMWRLQRTDNEWQIVRSDGDLQTVQRSLTASAWSDLRETPDGLDLLRREYGLALLAMLEEIRALADVPSDVVTEPTTDGLLADTWEDAGGIAFSELTGDGRDFSACNWSFRDPAESLMPLMLQTETDVAHFGAELAGFIERISADAGVVHSAGRFYDSEAGVQARDLLLGGRSFGVSVDPGHVVASWECVQEDEDGWCEQEKITFDEYEVIGLTMTPFPAFARAAIKLTGSESTSDAAAAIVEEPPESTLAVSTLQDMPMIDDHDFTDDNNDGFCDFCTSTAENGDCQMQCGGIESMHGTEEPPPDENAPQSAVSASVNTIARPTAPPAEWFHLPEPEPGMTASIEAYGLPANELLIEQPDGSLAVPLTITADRRVYGHLARWGQCHVGLLPDCVSPPQSACGYAHFHVGEVVCADGSRQAVGTFTVGCEHAPLMGLTSWEARDHYAHAGMGWANVRVSDGVYGPWACGILRPEITDEQVMILRTLSMSGDWRKVGGALELIGALSVNVPGFPIVRDVIMASGLGMVASGTMRGSYEDGVPQALVAAGIVHRCAECQKRAVAEARSLAAGGGTVTTVQLPEETQQQLREMSDMLGVLERRTRPLITSQRAELAERIRQGASHSPNGNGSH